MLRSEMHPVFLTFLRVASSFSDQDGSVLLIIPCTISAIDPSLLLLACIKLLSGSLLAHIIITDEEKGRGEERYVCIHAEIVAIMQPGLFWEYRQYPTETLDKIDAFLNIFAN